MDEPGMRGRGQAFRGRIVSAGQPGPPVRGCRGDDRGRPQAGSAQRCPCPQRKRVGGCPEDAGGRDRQRGFATEEHSQANMRRSRDEAVALVRRSVELAADRPDCPLVQAGIAMAFGCSISGDVDEEEVVRLARACAEAGADLIGLADTVGFAGPDQVGRLAPGWWALWRSRSAFTCTTHAVWGWPTPPPPWMRGSVSSTARWVVWEDAPLPREPRGMWLSRTWCSSVSARDMRQASTWTG